MKVDFRKYIVVLVIAVLFTVFVFSTINAFYEKPEYNDYCKQKPKPVTQTKGECKHIEASDEQIEACEGILEARYDEDGCVIEYVCKTCHKEYKEAREIYNRNAFVITSIIGIIAVLAGMYLPKEKNLANEWIGTAFMIGGLFVIGAATMMYFYSLHKFIKPIVIFIEMCLVIWLTYKKFSKNA